MASYKKLERDPANKVIAGVCSGLADYFNIDVALMRVLFVVAFICYSFGFWLYIILWIVLPMKQYDYYFGSDGERKSYGQNTHDADYQDVTREEDTKRRQNAAIVSSIILIVMGVIFLMNNFYPIGWLWKLWPALLVIAGVMIIINTQKNRNNE